MWGTAGALFAPTLLTSCAKEEVAQPQQPEAPYGETEIWTITGGAMVVGTLDNAQDQLAAMNFDQLGWNNTFGPLPRPKLILQLTNTEGDYMRLAMQPVTQNQINTIGSPSGYEVDTRVYFNALNNIEMTNAGRLSIFRRQNTLDANDPNKIVSQIDASGPNMTMELWDVNNNIMINPGIPLQNALVGQDFYFKFLNLSDNGGDIAFFNAPMNTAFTSRAEKVGPQNQFYYINTPLYLID
jgi:hypothetical protein